MPKVPVTGELGVSLYVRANRAGAQLFAWVVLPADIDPETRAPSYVLVPGAIFNRVDRWQKLEIEELVPGIEEQARVLRASSRRPVSLEGAYVERVVVNLMGGVGESDVFLDDLAVGPVPPKLAEEWAAGRSQGPGEKAAGGATPKAGTAREAVDAPPSPIRFSRKGFSRLVESQRRYVPLVPDRGRGPGRQSVALRRPASTC